MPTLSSRLPPRRARRRRSKEKNRRGCEKSEGSGESGGGGGGGRGGGAERGEGRGGREDGRGREGRERRIAGDASVGALAASPQSSSRERASGNVRAGSEGGSDGRGGERGTRRFNDARCMATVARHAKACLSSSTVHFSGAHECSESSTRRASSTNAQRADAA